MHGNFFFVNSGLTMGATMRQAKRLEQNVVKHKINAIFCTFPKGKPRT